MKKLNPKKLFVEFQSDTSKTSNPIPRYYTLTHSDETGDLFLEIGSKYAFDKITNSRDEVLAEWILDGDQYILKIDIYVGGIDFDYTSQIKRNEIFRKELPLALEAIRFGDSEFFKFYSILDKSPISINFYSVYPEFNKKEFWGSIQEYK